MALSALWTPPNRWETGEPMAAVKFNTFFSNNLLFLHQSPVIQGVINRGTGTDITVGVLTVGAQPLDSQQLSFYADIEEGVDYNLSTHLTMASNSSMTQLTTLIDGTTWSADGSNGAQPNIYEYKYRTSVGYQYLASFTTPIPSGMLSPGRHTFTLMHYNNAANTWWAYLSGHYAHYYLTRTSGLTKL